MRIRTAIAAAAGALVLAGCGAGSSDPEPAATPAKAQPTDVVSGKALSTYKGSPTYEWRKNLTSQAGFVVADLGKLDAAWHDDRSLSRVLDICMDLADGKDSATVARNAALRFTGGDVAKVTDADAKAIVDVARKYVCPDVD